MMQLLIITHTPSENTKNIARAIHRGAAKIECDNPRFRVRQLSPFEVNESDLRAADGIILFTTENFGYMSGALKDMFDRTYYGVIDSRRGLPYALVIRAGKDGTGARRSVETITKGLGWPEVQPPSLILQGNFNDDFLQQAEELGEGFALGLAEGIF